MKPSEMSARVLAEIRSLSGWLAWNRLSNGQHLFRDLARKAKGARKIIETSKRFW
jgi:hypothetical protein